MLPAGVQESLLGSIDLGAGKVDGTIVTAGNEDFATREQGAGVETSSTGKAA